MSLPLETSDQPGTAYGSAVPHLVRSRAAENSRPQTAAVATVPETKAAAPTTTDTHSAEAPEPSVWAQGLDWPIVIWIVVIHAGAIAAPFFFSWTGLIVGAIGCWLTGGIGVCMGYHRYFTHGSFQTIKPIRYLLAFLGNMSGEGSALTWVANHRKHHAHSDKDGDPHSPRDGGFWAHILWFMPNYGRKWHDDLSARWAPDLMKDPVIRFMHKTFLLQHWIVGLAMFAIGYFAFPENPVYMGWSMVTWGVFVRMVYVLHVTWFVNSATHMWGYRNYETTDDSTNLWWVGILAFGEGWHNNHHAFQRMAKHGHKWWEVDVTYLAICAMEKVGLAWNVVHEVPKHAKPA